MTDEERLERFKSSSQFEQRKMLNAAAMAITRRQTEFDRRFKDKVSKNYPGLLDKKSKTAQALLLNLFLTEKIKELRNEKETNRRQSQKRTLGLLIESTKWEIRPEQRLRYRKLVEADLYSNLFTVERSEIRKRNPGWQRQPRVNRIACPHCGKI